MRSCRVCPAAMVTCSARGAGEELLRGMKWSLLQTKAVWGKTDTFECRQLSQWWTCCSFCAVPDPSASHATEPLSCAKASPSGDTPMPWPGLSGCLLSWCHQITISWSRSVVRQYVSCWNPRGALHSSLGFLLGSAIPGDSTAVLGLWF